MQASMKIAVGLCLLAAMCASRAIDDPEDDLLAERIRIRNALEIVESITQRLERLKSDTKEDTIDEVTRRQWEEMDNFRKHSNLLRNEMRREVNAAKKKGIDAQPCYDTNSKGIDGHREAATKESEKCKETAEKNIQNILDPLDIIKLTGDSLINDLESLIMDCHDINSATEKACINGELTTINHKIEAYDNDVISAEDRAFIASNNVIRQANKCISDVYVLARSNGESSMDSNSKCVKDALERKSKEDRSEQLLLI
nr:PREDICTED: LOW QUALITY PROTEIN: uncharacterized protein LOC105672123 [Linepithema humile]